jgi:hypothetical protein
MRGPSRPRARLPALRLVPEAQRLQTHPLLSMPRLASAPALGRRSPPPTTSSAPRSSSPSPPVSPPARRIGRSPGRLIAPRRP